MSSHPKLRFKRCVVIVNSSSTHSARGQRYIKQLRKLFPADQLEIVNSPKDRKKNIQLVVRLSRQLDEHSLLCIAGGDGTVSTIINILLTNPEVSTKARRAVILPLWGGNANDLAHMANGSLHLTRLERLIAKARVVPIHPLAVTMQHKKNRHTKLAICYVSFGASAYAAHLISRPSHRNKRLYRWSGTRFIVEMISASRALLQAETFTSRLDGVNKPLYDLLLINGSRIAKVNRVPISIVDDDFYELLLPRKYPFILAYTIRLFQGFALKGFSLRQLTRTERELTVSEVTWSQIDGEAERVPGDTEITVRHHEQPFYILSTKLKT